jgi:hypothetical protein
MPKGPGKREARKTLKQRFKRQATRIATSGKDLSQKEIARRALNQAQRHHGRAAAVRDKRGRNATASTRAFAQANPSGSATVPRKVKKAAGRAIRSERTRTNKDPGTGKQLTALKAGRKAVKRSVRKGVTSVRQGSRALSDLQKMDPTTRRGFLNAQAVAAASRQSGNARTQQGKAISLALKGARQEARKASSKTKRATAKSNARTRRS